MTREVQDSGVAHAVKQDFARFRKSFLCGSARKQTPGICTSLPGVVPVRFARMPEPAAPSFQASAPKSAERLDQQHASERLGLLQIITLILSVYVLVALLIQSTVPLTPNTTTILERIDFVVCIVFLADFFVRYFRAPSKAKFLKWGWIDFISSIPMLNVFRVGRVVRIVRVFRILRAFRSTKNLVTYFLRHRRFTSFAAVIATSLSVMVFAAIAVLSFEDSPDSNIKNAGDAFWWAFCTITTVGYGDKYPLTAEGRIVACVLMTAGAGLFATMTGFIASMFLQPETDAAETEVQQLTAQVRVLAAKVDALLSLQDVEREQRAPNKGTTEEGKLS